MTDRGPIAAHRSLIRFGQITSGLVILAGLFIMLTPFLFRGQPFQVYWPAMAWLGLAAALLVVSEFALRRKEREWRKDAASPESD